MWYKIAIRVLHGEKNIQSPFHKDGVIKSIPVMVDKNDKIGFLIIWCSETFRGIQISRLTIPDTVDYISSEEFREMDFPDYPKIKFEEPY